ncbi:protein SPEAR3-like [Silene latifolia]|uniref:protein SPEAR3-like n=1 Tax=Silene latifolia TaxID=37657 RepID=UPI003D771C61
MGNDKKHEGSSSSNSSKKSKSSSNNSNLDKPKQPQRGLGVAQLEKIRLHTQMANFGFIPQHQFPSFPTSFSPSPFQEDMRIQAGYHQAALQSSFAPYGYVPVPPPGYNHPNNFMMGFGEHMQTTGNIKFGESHPSITNRWNPTNHMVAMPENNHMVAMPENNQYIQPQGLVTRHLLSHVEQNNGRNNSLQSNVSSSRSRTEDEELDLELKL